MKKFIVAFDGLKYAKNTEKVSLALARITDAHLVGIFPDDITYTSYIVNELIKKKGVSAAQLKKYEAADAALRKQSAQRFADACKREGVHFSLHEDKKIAIQWLKHESIYADLLLLSMAETFSRYSRKPPTRFIRDLLGDLECPVLLIPEKYRPFEKIILLYDGKPSSVFAIKMLSYVLPELKTLPAEIISVTPGEKSLHLPDNRLMKEFMKRHYPDAVYTVLKGLAEDEIIARLRMQQSGCLVVLGAYRRSTVSRWFHESMADIIMKELGMPLFIAHNK